jgi:uncharacterized protein YdcH (DUF465 family)
MQRSYLLENPNQSPLNIASRVLQRGPICNHGGCTMVNGGLLNDQLMAENKDFKKWVDLHSELEHKLERLNRLKYLSAAEEFERKRLQKHKLMVKDKMHYMIHQLQR